MTAQEEAWKSMIALSNGSTWGTKEHRGKEQLLKLLLYSEIWVINDIGIPKQLMYLYIIHISIELTAKLLKHFIKF